MGNAWGNIGGALPLLGAVFPRYTGFMESMIKTFILLAALTALFLMAGYALGGQEGAMIGFFIAAAMNLSAWWRSDKMVLAHYRARPLDEQTAPALFATTRTLVERAGLPMPKLYIIEGAQPNAFATGRNPQNAAVAVTEGLLSQLTLEEVTGVVAHELAHVKNRDTLIMTIAATIAGAISFLANIAVFMPRGGGNSGNSDGQQGGGSPLGGLGAIFALILAPLAATIVQMAVSRAREYEADATGAAICNNPLWLASALQKIEGAARQTPYRRAAEKPATASMFIITPLYGMKIGGLFQSHPPTAERVRRLQQMAASATPTPWD